MSRLGPWIPGWGLALAAVGLLAAVSRAPQRTAHGDGGLLRLSWSGQPERIEVCRNLTDQEVRNLPRHMRRQTICEGRAARYRLQVTVDGTTLADESVTGGGLRSDRPVYLYREFPLPGGRHSVRLRLDLADDPVDIGDERAVPHRLDALPRALVLDTVITLTPRTVTLVTYDAERHSLVMRSGGN